MQEAPAEAAVVDTTLAPLATCQFPLAAATPMESAPSKATATPAEPGLAATASPRVQTNAKVTLWPRLRGRVA